ncbi:MAG TPA: ATP-binding protein [Acidobacteriaceae bacterium]|nr:ATP-binding protein [Acidobacteriaceae bacterium]
MSADTRSWIRAYRSVEGISQDVREADLSGSHRLLFHVKDGSLYLLDMGKHEVVPRYVATSSLSSELRSATEPPADLGCSRPPGFFTFDAETEWRAFANEAEPSWISYLDSQQEAVVASILERVDQRSQASRAWNLTVIVGGPGTGKTSILLNLLDRAFAYNLMPEIVVSDALSEYIASASFVDIAPYRTTVEQGCREQRGDILLVDDPDSASQLQDLKWLAQTRAYKAVVVAFDPLQLTDRLDDRSLENLVSGSGAARHYLTACYRQKEVVGRAAKRSLDALAASSEFHRGSRKWNAEGPASRRLITELANNVVFRNPSGRAKVHATATPELVRQEVRRIARARHIWKHWPPLLVALDDEHEVHLPAELRSALDDVPHHLLSLSAAPTIKGLEFQHAFLFLSYQLFQELECGFEGVGKSLYRLRRLYRIPFTRAKDSIVTFVVQAAG